MNSRKDVHIMLKQVEQTMDNHFGLPNELRTNKAQMSLFINNALLGMSNEDMTPTIQTYGLLPIERYLDLNSNSSNASSNENIQGFVRYVDIYILEHTGGGRRRIATLAKELVNIELPISTARLMRVQLIHTIFERERFLG